MVLYATFNFIFFSKNIKIIEIPQHLLKIVKIKNQYQIWHLKVPNKPYSMNFSRTILTNKNNKKMGYFIFKPFFNQRIFETI